MFNDKLAFFDVSEAKMKQFPPSAPALEALRALGCYVLYTDNDFVFFTFSNTREENEPIGLIDDKYWQIGATYQAISSPIFSKKVLKEIFRHKNLARIRSINLTEAEKGALISYSRRQSAKNRVKNENALSSLAQNSSTLFSVGDNNSGAITINNYASPATPPDAPRNFGVTSAESAADNASLVKRLEILESQQALTNAKILALEEAVDTRDKCLAQVYLLLKRLPPGVAEKGLEGIKNGPPRADDDDDEPFY